jgi:nicotinamide riboside kinase
MHIWSEHKYGRTDAYILDAFQQQDFNLLFLCDTDIPWEFDPLREHPELRSYFLEKYKNTLHAARKPFELISGDHQTRVNTCLQIIRKKFPEKFN